MKYGYISDELIHWTGHNKKDDEAFNVLKAICKERVLRLSYCPNYDRFDFKLESAMVCFTEIPLRFSHKHCCEFGNIGIAFNKQKMIEYGANPVLYTTDKHFLQIENIAFLLKRMKDLEKDREWKEYLQKYQFISKETIALQEVMEFLQDYTHKNKDNSDYVNYYQREWRLTFNSCPFAGGNKHLNAGMAGFYIREGKSYKIFKFSDDDVEYIVLPKKYECKAKHITESIGCCIRVYENEVNI